MASGETRLASELFALPSPEDWLLSSADESCVCAGSPDSGSGGSVSLALNVDSSSGVGTCADNGTWCRTGEFNSDAIAREKPLAPVAIITIDRKIMESGISWEGPVSCMRAVAAARNSLNYPVPTRSLQIVHQQDPLKLIA